MRSPGGARRERQRPEAIAIAAELPGASASGNWSGERGPKASPPLRSRRTGTSPGNSRPRLTNRDSSMPDPPRKRRPNRSVSGLIKVTGIKNADFERRVINKPGSRTPTVRTASSARTRQPNKTTGLPVPSSRGLGMWVGVGRTPLAERDAASPIHRQCQGAKRPRPEGPPRRLWRRAPAAGERSDPAPVACADAAQGGRPGVKRRTPR